MAITSLTILPANGIIADGVDGADAADSNGWVAKVVLPDDGTNLFDPTKIVITANDPGFDGAGNLLLAGVGGPVRTIRGTRILRRQRPNNTSRMNFLAAGVRTVYFALSAQIFVGTQISAAAELGYYNAAPAHAIATVANNSQKAYAKPTIGWTNAQHDLASGANVYVEAAVHHRWGRNRKSVACVKFQASEGANSTPVVTATQPTLSTLCKQGQPPEVWAAYVAQANLTQGAQCLMNLKAYPHLGDATAVLDLSVDGINLAGDVTTPLPDTPLRFICDKAGTYSQARAYVRPTGTLAGASTAGVFTADQAYGLADGQCYPTVDAAAQAIQAWHQTNKARNNVAGGRVYMTDTGAGGAVVHTSINCTRTAGACWLDIRKDPNALGAVSFTLTTQQAVPARTRVMVDTFHSAANGLNGFNTAGKMIAFEECTVTMNGTAVPLWFQNPLVTLRNVTLVNPLGNWAVPFNGPDLMAMPLILGVVADTVNANSIISVGYTVLGNRLRRGVIEEVNKTNYPNHTSQNRCVWANNLFLDVRDTTRRDLGTAAPLTGFAVVQNVWENTRPGTISGSLFGIAPDGSTNTIDDVLFAHNSLPDTTITGRYNGGYADTAVGVVKRVSLLYNIFGQYNIKSDVFTTQSSASGRTGNWQIVNGVDVRGNLILISTNGESAPDGDGNSWLGDYLDPVSNKLGARALTFADNKSGQSAAGGGNYRLTGNTNDAYGKVPAGAQMLAFDLAGIARRDDGTGAAGAYETTVNAPVSGGGGGTVEDVGSGGTGKVAVKGGGGGAVGTVGSTGGGGLTPATGQGGGTLGSVGGGGGGEVTTAPITAKGEIIATAERLVHHTPVPSGAGGGAALPQSAPNWVAPFDPADRTPFAMDWSQLLAEGETIAQIDRIKMSAEGAALGIEIDTSVGRTPIISQDGTQTQFWFMCNASFQTNAAFAGGGVQIGLSVLVRTTANPFKLYERTAILTARQQ